MSGSRPPTRPAAPQRTLLVCSAILLAIAHAQPPSSNWIRFEAPGLELLTDASPATGQRVLQRLTQIRELFGAAIDSGAASPRQLRVFLFDSEAEFRRFTDSRITDGFFQSALDRDYIVTYARTGLARVVVHEYLHFLMNGSPVPRPHWFEEGMAEFYSNLEFAGDRLTIGAPLASHRDLLGREPLLDAVSLSQPPEAVAESAGASLAGQERLGSVYYAQSWALVHMLSLDPAFRNRLPAFLDALSQQEPLDAPDELAVFESTFDQTLDQAIASLPAYLRTMQQLRIDAPPTAPSRELTPVSLEEPHSLLLRAELALRCSRMETARGLYEQAASRYPALPETAAGLGLLAMAERRTGDARTHLEAAIDAGSADASVWFTYAMWLEDGGGSPARIRELLQRTIELNPGFGQAHLLLGVRATDDGLKDPSRYRDAVDHLRQASRLMPSESHVWHALAYAESLAGQTGDAIRSAYRAVRTAQNSMQTRMSETLLESLRRPDSPNP